MPLRLPEALDTVDVSKPAPVIMVLATVCEMLTTYSIPFVLPGTGPTMYVPGSIVIASSREMISPTNSPNKGTFVKAESVRVVPEIEPVVVTVQGLLLEAGSQKIEGVDVVR